MSRKKKSRKQPTSASVAAAARKLSQQQAEKDFLKDGRARLSAWLWAISLTFGYGVVNNVILNRPERQVSLEALGVCLGTIAFRVAAYYTAAARSNLPHGLTERLWRAGQFLARKRFVRIIGVSTVTTVLVLNAMPMDALEPAIATWILRRSNAGLIPGMDSELKGTHPAYRFREASGRIARSIDARVPSDPNTVSEVRDSLARVVQNVRLPENVEVAAKLELAYLQTYETLSRIGAADPRILRQISSGYTPGIPTVIGAGVDKTTLFMTPSATTFAEVGPNPLFFSGFTVISFGHNPGSPIPQFAISNSNNTEVVFNDVKVEGLAQDIGSLTWTNVTFQGCLVRYHGQPVGWETSDFSTALLNTHPTARGSSSWTIFQPIRGSPSTPMFLEGKGYAEFDASVSPMNPTSQVLHHSSSEGASWGSLSSPLPRLPRSSRWSAFAKGSSYQFRN